MASQETPAPTRFIHETSLSAQPQPTLAITTIPGTETPVPAIPVKRKRGRPKGTGKKQLAAAAALANPDGNGVPPNFVPSNVPVEPKVKRPVGRPRKDGLPSGSVATKKRKKEESPFPTAPQLAYPNFGMCPPPPWSTYHPGVHVPPPSHPLPQPSASTSRIGVQSEWAHLHKRSPSEFLHALVAELRAFPCASAFARPSPDDVYKSHLHMLNTSPRQQPSPSSMQAPGPPIPMLYLHDKTFWLPYSPPYFALTTSANIARAPLPHRFFYWDPLPLVFNGLPCPLCSHPLSNGGRIKSGPIKVYDLESPYWIIGSEYICTFTGCPGRSEPGNRDQCPKRFASTDSAILKCLPAPLRAELPTVLLSGQHGFDRGPGEDVWNGGIGGVSSAVWKLVQVSLAKNMAKEDLLDTFKHMQLPISTGPDSGEVHEAEEQQQHHELDELGESHRSQTLSQSRPSDRPTSTSAVSMELSTVNGTDHRMDRRHEEQSSTPSTQQSVPAESQHNQGSSQLQLRTSSNGQSTESTPATASPQVPQQSGPIYPYAPHMRPGPGQEHSSPMPGPFGYPRPPFSFVGGPPIFSAPPQRHAPPSASGFRMHQPQPAEGVAGGSSSQQQQQQNNVASTSRTTLHPSAGPAAPQQRRPRHCSNCGTSDCKGKGGRVFCSGACRDCGRLECKGRNSRRPEKDCREAWGQASPSTS